MGKGERSSEGISNPKVSGDAMNDEAKTSEKYHKGDVGGERDSEMERR